MFKLFQNTIKNVAIKALFSSCIAIFPAACLPVVAKEIAIKPSPRAPVDISQAWVRSSVQGQKATGAFMAITAKEDLKLIGAASPIAGVVEVHEMKLEGDIMRMRAVVGGLVLPAGKTVELKPGGYHVMLMDLKTAAIKDTTVPLTLLFSNARGTESLVTLALPVSTTPPMNQHKH